MEILLKRLARYAGGQLARFVARKVGGEVPMARVSEEAVDLSEILATFRDSEGRA